MPACPDLTFCFFNGNEPVDPCQLTVDDLCFLGMSVHTWSFSSPHCQLIGSMKVLWRRQPNNTYEWDSRFFKGHSSSNVCKEMEATAVHLSALQWLWVQCWCSVQLKPLQHPWYWLTDRLILAAGFRSWRWLVITHGPNSSARLRSWRADRTNWDHLQELVWHHKLSALSSA